MKNIFKGKTVSYWLIGIACLASFVFVSENREMYSVIYQAYLGYIGLLLISHSFTLWWKSERFRWDDLLGASYLLHYYPNAFGNGRAAGICLRILFYLYAASLYLMPAIAIALELNGIISHDALCLFFACQAGISIVLYTLVQLKKNKRENKQILHIKHS